LVPGRSGRGRRHPARGTARRVASVSPWRLGPSVVRRALPCLSSFGLGCFYHMSVVTRFAPSPTGYLHLGHAFSALIAWRRAREAGGRFLLRLEDIDPTRCRPEFAAAIQEDLAWLGLDWDGPVRVQSAHLAEYQAALDDLAARGLVYPCFCTRAD